MKAEAVEKWFSSDGTTNTGMLIFLYPDGMAAFADDSHDLLPAEVLRGNARRKGLELVATSRRIKP